MGVKQKLDEVNNSILSGNIKRLRLKRKLLQREVASSIGINTLIISFYENNKPPQSLVSLLKLTKALDCSLETLLKNIK